MENKTRKELYQILTTGDSSQRKEANEILLSRDKNLKSSLGRAIAPGIMLRNLSHGIGKFFNIS